MEPLTAKAARPVGLLRPALSGRVSGGRDNVVVFLLGARVHKPWKLRATATTYLGFIKMARWLDKHPEAGLLGTSFTILNGGVAAVQYWDSYDALERFAHNRDAPHLSAWAWYRRAVEQPGDVGIWHETYVLSPGSWECIYVNMPPAGLPAATGAVSIHDRRGSRSRRATEQHE